MLTQLISQLTKGASRDIYKINLAMWFMARSHLRKQRHIQIYKIIFIGISLVLSACSKAKPELKLLNGSLSKSSTNNLEIRIERNSGQAAITSSSSIIYKVIFSEDINTSSFTSSDISTESSYAGTCSVIAGPTQVSGSDYKNFTFTFNCFGDGVVIPNILPTNVLNTTGSTFLSKDNSTAGVTVDTVPPINPSMSVIIPASSPSNSTTATVRVSDVTAGDSVTLYSAAGCSVGALVSTQTAATTYSDFLLVGLTAGTQSYYAKVTDTAGLSSSCSSTAASWTIDLTAPSAPSTLSLSSPSTSPNSDSTPSIDVSGVSSSDTIKLFTDSSCTSQVASGAAAGSSIILTTSTLADGSYTFYANATDSAGNTSTCSTANVSYVLSTSAPNAPTSVTLMTPSSSPGNTVSPVFIVGGVTSGHTIKLFTDSACTNLVSTGTASSSSITLASSSLTAGSYTFYATATNTSSVSSTCSTASASYTLDLTAPAIPSSISLNSPSASPGNDDTPTFLISGVTSGDTIYLFNDSSCTTQLASGVSAGTTILLSSSSLSDSSYSFYAKARDPAGNYSSCSTASISYTLDTVAPSAPSSLSLFSPSSSPSIVTTPTIQVQGVSGADIVRIYSDSSCIIEIGSGTPSGSFANVSVTSAMAVGSYSIYAKSLDLASNGSSCSSTFINYQVLLTVTVDQVYSGFGNWNHYVKSGPTACTGSETGPYGNLSTGCVHAGLARKVVVTGETTCSNLSLQDDNNVFLWTCDAGSGTATFYIKDFNPGKGLRDLINPSGPTWNSKSVTVTKTGTLAQSTASPWWGDTFTQLPANSAMAALSPSGSTIYYNNSSVNIEAFKLVSSPYPISIVSLANYSLTALGTSSGNIAASGCSTGIITNVMFCFSASNFIWVELNLIGQGTYYANSGVYFDTVKYSRIHNTNFDSFSPSIGSGNYSAQIHLTSSQSNMLTNNYIYGGSRGIYLSSSSYNTIRRNKIGNLAGTGAGISAGIHLKTSSTYNLIHETAIDLVKSGTGNSYGMLLESTSNSNIISYFKISNIQGAGTLKEGLALLTSSNSNVFTQGIITSNDDAGIYISTSNNNLFTHITNVNNLYNSIYLGSGAQTNNTFINTLNLNSSGTNGGIESAASSGTIFFNDTVAAVNAYPWKRFTGSITATFGGYFITHSSPTCDSNGSNLTSSCNIGASPPITFGSFTNAFVGQLSTDDSYNPLGSSNTSFGSLIGLDNWMKFDNDFRNWGKYYGGSFPSASNLGAIYSGTVNIWDWRVRSQGNGGMFHNVSASGNTTNSNLTLSGTCSGPVDGNLFYNLSSPSRTILKNAIEIFDGIGNDDSLCESGEECIYTPNIGAYQGEGTLSSAYCTTSGTVSGARIFAYPTTGI